MAKDIDRDWGVQASMYMSSMMEESNMLFPLSRVL